MSFGAFNPQDNKKLNNQGNLILGLLAHVDAGKTTLTESLLYQSGMIKEMGRVDRQNAFLDTEDLEKQRGITIFSKQAVIHEKQGDIILMDTPGHVDFSAEMERTLGILDAAVLIISGSEGIESHTRTLWRLLKAYRIPVFIFVNKMDQPTADKSVIIRQLKENFGDGCIDMSKERVDEDVGSFYEELATGSEELLDEYLAEDKISTDTIIKNIKTGIVFPVYFGSALRNSGIDELYDDINQYRLTINITRNKNLPENEKFSGKVYKIAHDPQGVRLTYVKITEGEVAVRDLVTYELRDSEVEGSEDDPDSDNSLQSITEKVTGIRLYSGAGFEQLSKAGAGTVVALTGLNGTYAGQGFGREKDQRNPSLMPALSYRMELPEGCDPVSVLPMVRTLAQEDPQLHLNWDKDKKEITLGLMGEIQTQVIKSVIKDRFGLSVEFSPGSIIYKETILNTVEGVGHYEPLRHYAEVHLLIEPGDRGSGMRFENHCNPDTLPGNYQKLVISHLFEREHKGILTGSVLTDVKITLKSGRSHLKHTEGGDFRQATYRAVRQGLMQAEHLLLEPYYEFTLLVPENYIGRAMTDLDNMKCTFSPSEITDGFAAIKGRGPVACMQSYGRLVSEYTRGLGRLELSMWGYDKCHNPLEVIEERGYDPDEDIRNPSYSVFCSHGAGFPVPWYEVPDYMHLPSVLEDDYREGDDLWEEAELSRLLEEKERHITREEDVFIGSDEVDSIISQASGANKKALKGYRKGIAGKSRLNKRRVEGGYRLASGNTPRVRNYSPAVKKPEYLLVDGYNIIFAWDELRALAEDNVDGARGSLLDVMSNYRGLKGCEIIVVFDAYRLKNHPEEVSMYHNVCVVFTREAETADAYIEKFAHKNSDKYDITVATSDGLEQIIIRGAGARLMSASDLESEVKRVSKEAVSDYASKAESSKVYLGDSMPEVF